MRKIGQKRYHAIFKAMTNLYGIIDSEDIKYVLDFYFPEMDIDEINEKLKAIFNHPKRDYFVSEIEGEENNYYLINSSLDDKRINELIDEIGEKELYIPDSLETFLKYQRDSFLEEESDKAYTKLMYFLYKNSRNIPKEEKEAYAFYFTFYVNFKVRSGMMDEDFVEAFRMRGYEFKSKKKLEEFIDIYLDTVNNTKMFSNRGFSPREIMERHPEILDEMKDGLGNTIANLVGSGMLDINELLTTLENNGFDEDEIEKIKDSLLDRMGVEETYDA